MPRKTKIIFITVFVIVGLIVLGLYLWGGKKDDTSGGATPLSQIFNPFGTGNPTTNNEEVDVTDQTTNPTPGEISRFYKITDFAVAGATFLEDTRPIFYPENEPASEPEVITTVISADTKEGRKEIQIFLNKELSLEKPLVVDGSFGKLATEAIKEFQKLKGLPVTGKVDAETAPYFTKTVIPTIS